MAKKVKPVASNWSFFVIILFLAPLIAVVYIVKKPAISPDALAAQAGTVLECAPGTKPQYTRMSIISSKMFRPQNWKTMTRQEKKTYINQLIADFKSNCTWECDPLPSGIEYVKPSDMPVVTLPAGSMPKPTREPYPKPICLDVYCPLNCVQTSNISGCPICNCNSIVVK